MEQSEKIDLLAKALIEVQKILKPVPRKQTNPFFKSKYADLEAVWESIREPLTKNGLAITQTMDGENGQLYVITTLLHESGQWIRGRLPIPTVKPDPQATGSSITYGRRYSLSAIIGVVSEEDDDAEGAMNRKNKSQPDEKQKKGTNKGTTKNFEFLKTSGELKTKLKELTESDERYYAILGSIGYEHANEITERQHQVVFFKSLNAEIKRLNEDPDNPF